MSRAAPEVSADALAKALADAHGDADLLATAERLGPAFARRFAWDGIAARQGEVYTEAIGAPAERGAG